MASIIDSFRDVFTDRLSFLKFAVLAAPVYYSYQVYLQSKTGLTGFFWIAGITIFFLLGFIIKITNNVLSEGSNNVLPSLNPLKLAFVALKGLAALLPYTLISCWIANYVCSLIYIIPWLDITLKVIIWLITASIIFTAFLMFAENEKIKDAYNFKVLSKASGDMILVLIFFIIQLIIMNLPTIGFLGYTLLILFGYGPIFDYFLAIAVVFNIAIIGHYMAQVHYELLGFDKSFK